MFVFPFWCFIRHILGQRTSAVEFIIETMSHQVTVFHVQAIVFSWSYWMCNVNRLQPPTWLFVRPWSARNRDVPNSKNVWMRGSSRDLWPLTQWVTISCFTLNVHSSTPKNQLDTNTIAAEDLGWLSIDPLQGRVFNYSLLNCPISNYHQPVHIPLRGTDKFIGNDCELLDNQ